MNEVALNDKNLSMDRTPQLIAIEINSIKEQTRKIMLFNSIEIGKRLAEAKIMLGHGEWGDWLKESVDYSQRTASNLMGIFEQYGTSQLNMFCENNAKSQALANLSYTQAVLMMGIPQDEREAFIEEHDVENLSTRELQQAIKDRDHALKQTQELQEALKGATNHISEIVEDRDKAKDLLGQTQKSLKLIKDALTEEKEKSKREIIRLGQSIAEMNKSIEEAQASGSADEVEHLNKLLVETDGELHTAYKKIEDLERQLKEDPIEVTAAPVSETIPEEVERELNELRDKNKELEAKGAQPVNTATIRFKLHFDSLVKGFGDLLGVLGEIDAEARDKYKNAVSGLIVKMSERL